MQKHTRNIDKVKKLINKKQSTIKRGSTTQSFKLIKNSLKNRRKTYIINSPKLKLRKLSKFMKLSIDDFEINEKKKNKTENK